MRWIRAFTVVSLLLTVWLAGPAHAQPAGANDDAAPDTLIEQAARAYDDNQLDEALRLLRRAYELSSRPWILYNQAQVLRAQGDCAGALDAYRQFLDSAAVDDANRERATRWRDEMQACVERQHPPPPAPVKLTAPEPARPAPPAGVIVSAANPVPAAPGHRRALRATGWAMLGLGVAATAAAVALAWEAHDIQNEVNGQLQWKTGQPPPTWTADLASRASDGEHAATGAWLCAGLAALAGGGSAALFILSRPAAERDGPGPSRAALLGWSGTF